MRPDERARQFRGPKPALPPAMARLFEALNRHADEVRVARLARHFFVAKPYRYPEALGDLARLLAVASASTFRRPGKS